MTANISFSKSSWSDWIQLDTSTKNKLEKLLRNAAEQPTSAGAYLRGEFAGLQRLKLTTPQVRIVFRYQEPSDTLEIIAVGSRENIYQIASKRINSEY